jgi:hypothetical protein
VPVIAAMASRQTSLLLPFQDGQLVIKWSVPGWRAEGAWAVVKAAGMVALCSDWLMAPAAGNEVTCLAKTPDNYCLESMNWLLAYALSSQVHGDQTFNNLTQIQLLQNVITLSPSSAFYCLEHA